MQKSALILMLMGVAVTVGAAENPSASPEPTGTPLPTCNYSSKTPEEHTFYGEKEIITQKLSDWSAKPSEHRVMVQITQGDSGGEVKLFERHENGRYTVTDWSPRHTAELIAAIERAIMANKGVNCVGEQMKAVLKKLGKGHTVEDVAEPASASAAFSHAVKESSGDFIQTVIVFGC
jgi:hypothetical protein